ncbi:integrase [Actinomadura viridis]|uniref:Integrase n=1 Tax=Actinomadura viridis TaxID=58110 RepID=A0A931DQC4_9ACTN|nr:integrase [Actinomadura viridis]
MKQAAERADAWQDWEDNGLVFPSRRGTPMEPDNLRRSWGRIREAAGLESMRFHDMRHTCVSLLLALGIPPHIVRDIVGHSDIEVTMTIYAHAALDEKRAALGEAGGCARLRPLLSKGPEPILVPGLLAGHLRWAGAGSNRRPSAFQK